MAINVSFYFGLLLLCFQRFEVHGSQYVTTDPQGIIVTECRDRFYWVSVDVSSAPHAPRFEAVVDNGVHSITEDHASMCGYTLKNLNGHASLRASYFSCHAENQNDNNFLFKLNVVLTDQEGRENKYTLSETCTLPMDWSAKEVLCEENYIEVTVARDTPCTSDKRTTKEAWLAALALAQRSAISEWQILFLNKDNMDAMSVSDARRMRYMVDSTPNRVVFRSAYHQPHSTITEIDGIAVEVIHSTVFFRQKWAVVMLDTSAACTIAPSIFDGVNLHWRTPKLMTPLVQDASGFVSKNIRLGVEAQLLDEATREAMGYALSEDGQMVHVSVPFGAPGGYRRSLVENNIYKESYIVFLCYEHTFAHVFMDRTEVETRLRQLRVLETPLISRIPFTVDETVTHEEVFTVYLGNFAPDVQLTAVKLNDNYLSVTDAVQLYFISKVSYINGTHGFIIKVPFEDQTVNRAYLGEGLLQYSMEINYTLNIMGQNDTFYHHVSVVAQVNDAFPPEVTAVCRAHSIVFTMNHPKQAGLWEVCVGPQALTSDLTTLRGYMLKNDSHSLSLEVPLFTAGYIYEDITLRNFIGTFEVTVRDSKTLEIHRRVVKRCLFPTAELTVCSKDGMMTVVATTTKTWPTVPPISTTLLDKKCRPTSTDETRVLFSFGVTTCGTRLMVGDGYIVYENEIVSDRGGITDQGSAITRESKFRLTVRCFYPLNSVNKVFTARLFEAPGFGTMKFTDNTDAKGPQENLISSQIASVFDPKPWPINAPYNQLNPGRNCGVTDQARAFLQRGVPHSAYSLPNLDRETLEDHGRHISHQYKPASQLFKRSGMHPIPQTTFKHNYSPSVTPARQQDFYNGLSKDYKSSFDVPQKTMKRSSQNVSHIKDNAIMIGDDTHDKATKNASSIVNENSLSFLQSPSQDSSNDQPDLKEYVQHRTPHGGFQHFSDNSNEVINNLPPSHRQQGGNDNYPNKTYSLHTLVNQTNKNLNTAASLSYGNLISDKLVASDHDHVLPTSSTNPKIKYNNGSGVQPLKVYDINENRRLVHQVDNHNNFMYDLPNLFQQKKEVQAGNFLYDHKALIKSTPDGSRGTLFYSSGGKASRYGSSIHKGIIRGDFPF